MSDDLDDLVAKYNDTPARTIREFGQAGRRTADKHMREYGHMGYAGKNPKTGEGYSHPDEFIDSMEQEGANRAAPEWGGQMLHPNTPTSAGKVDYKPGVKPTRVPRGPSDIVDPSNLPKKDSVSKAWRPFPYKDRQGIMRQGARNEAGSKLYGSDAAHALGEQAKPQGQSAEDMADEVSSSPPSLEQRVRALEIRVNSSSSSQGSEGGTPDMKDATGDEESLYKTLDLLEKGKPGGTPGESRKERINRAYSLGGMLAAELAAMRDSTRRARKRSAKTPTDAKPKGMTGSQAHGASQAGETLSALEGKDADPKYPDRNKPLEGEANKDAKQRELPYRERMARAMGMAAGHTPFDHPEYPRWENAGKKALAAEQKVRERFASRAVGRMGGEDYEGRQAAQGASELMSHPKYQKDGNEAVNKDLAKLEKKFGISTKGVYSGSAGPQRIGYPAHMEGNNVSIAHSEDSHTEDPTMDINEQSYPAEDDHAKESTNLPVLEGKRPHGSASLPNATLDDLDKPYVSKAGAGRSLGGAAMGGLAGLAMGGPLGAVLGAAAGHHMQHGSSPLAGSSGDQKKPGPIAEAIGQRIREGGKARQATGIATRQAEAKTRANVPKPVTKPSTNGRMFGSTKPSAPTKFADGDEDLPGTPVFIVPHNGKLRIHEAIRSPDMKAKGLGIYQSIVKGLPGMAGGGTIGYLMGGPIGALAGGALGDKLADEPDEESDEQHLVVPDDEGKHHVYDLIPEEEEADQVGKSVAGAAAGAYMGYLIGGPAGAVVAGYLGHKIPGSKDPAPTPAEGPMGKDEAVVPILDDYAPMPHGGKKPEAPKPAPGHFRRERPIPEVPGASQVGEGKVERAGKQEWRNFQQANKDGEEGSHETPEETPEEADERRKKQANENIGGGLEQKPDGPMDAHDAGIMADFQKQGLTPRLAHLAAFLRTGGEFRKNYDARCDECRTFVNASRKPDAYYKSLAKAIDTGMVGLGSLSPTDITRFHKERTPLERVLKKREA